MQRKSTTRETKDGKKSALLLGCPCVEIYHQYKKEEVNIQIANCVDVLETYKRKRKGGKGVKGWHVPC